MLKKIILIIIAMSIIGNILIAIEEGTTEDLQSMVGGFFGLLILVFFIKKKKNLTSRHRNQKFGICTFCGGQVGNWQTKHKECYEKYANGLAQAKEILTRLINNQISYADADKLLEELKANNSIIDAEIKDMAASIWEYGVDVASKDCVLSIEEEKTLVNFLKRFNLSRKDVDNNNKYNLYCQGIALRQLSNGCVPTLFSKPSGLPFNFTKEEKFIWRFSNVKYIETKTKVKYRGNSAGLSFRVAKGVYLRTGAFRGRPIHYQQQDHLDTGMIVVTNKHIYFGGRKCNFRIRFDRIVAFTPYSKGVGVQKEGTTALPQAFLLDDNVFFYNLISNVGALNL